MFDENVAAVHDAGPSKPVQVLGWSHVPMAGDEFKAVSDEREARRIAQEREAQVACGGPGLLAAGRVVADRAVDPGS